MHPVQSIGYAAAYPLNPPLPLKRFKLLAQDTMNNMAAARGRSITGVDAELDRYMQEVTDVDSNNSLLFWQEREHSYPLLSPLAEAFISAPASQAYVERVFTVCGDLCCRKRNRATKCLERRMFLKMNRKLVSA